MNKNYKLAPSILSADFSVLKDEIISVKTADYLHIDVMDGIFVPNISIGIPIIKSIRKTTDLIFDVHLMIDRPARFIKEFANVGADIITVHAEASENLKNDLEMIKSLGKKSAVAIKPNTQLNVIYNVLEKVDMILIMSVEPGFGGQKLIESTLEKSFELSQVIADRNLNVDIEMDGGINLENVEKVMQAGVNIIVAGSAIFNFQNRPAIINQFKQKFLAD